MSANALQTVNESAILDTQESTWVVVRSAAENQTAAGDARSAERLRAEATMPGVTVQKSKRGFVREYQLRGGRCVFCQRLIPFACMTKEHLYTRHNGDRDKRGSAWTLSCERCNKARGGLRIGSPRFEKWLRRVMRGDIRPFARPDNARRADLSSEHSRP